MRRSSPDLWRASFFVPDDLALTAEQAQLDPTVEVLTNKRFDQTSLVQDCLVAVEQVAVHRQTVGPHGTT